MNGKKYAALLAAALLFVFLCPAAQAKSWTESDFTFDVPEEFVYIIDRNTELDDPAWTLAGVADPMSRFQEFAELGIIGDLYTEEGKTNVMVIEKENDTIQSIYNLKDMTQQERDAFLEQLIQSQSDQLSLEKSYVDVHGQPFYRVKMDLYAEGQEVHEMLYGTIFNGHTLTFQMYRSGRPLEEEEMALLEQLAASVQVTQVLPKPEAQPVDVLPTAIVLLLIVLVVLAPIVVLPVQRRREKRQKAQMATLLSEYHKTHGNAAAGPVLFENETECGKEAIHAFSIYHAYLKNLVPLILEALLCLLVLVAVFLLDLTWWLKVLAGLVTVYYIYQAVSTPGNVERVQTKVLGRGLSSTAHYSFFEDAFRVSGIQSASMIPYFQITDVRKHGHYLYLYYSTDNMYPVDQNGFKSGEYEEFVKFIREKTGKK